MAANTRWLTIIWRRVREPSTALLAAAILFPLVLFTLAARHSYVEALQEAEGRAERTAHMLEEHALKVFETHRLVIQQVNLRMRFVDWSKDADQFDLHRLLRQAQDDLDQIATVTVVDAQGRLRASGRVYPPDPKITFLDRDYFKALRDHDSVIPYISASYRGRTSGVDIFNLASRVAIHGDRRFDGVIAVSVDRNYFETFYRSVEPAIDHSVDLVRSDGAILARVPSVNLSAFPRPSRLLDTVKSGEHSALYTSTSVIDGVPRIFALRKIGEYPVYVSFGISLDAALAPWRASLVDYGVEAGLAMIALVSASILALRQTERERVARHRWQETAAALQAEATERQKVEQQLRQAQKMEAVGRITGGVAHDFNNLLTAVIGSLDLIKRRSAQLDARVQTLVNNALEGAQRAAALTSRLLAFSRQQPLQPRVLDVNGLISGMSELLRRSLGETIRITTDLAADLPPVHVDANQLESAILNLAVNARDAMPEGGDLRIVTSRVGVRQAMATADLPAGDYVVMRVTDSGTGMTPEVLANVFEPFFTTKPIGKGTGLGLSQVYGFVKQSGGHVAIDSAVHMGSTFSLYLPAARREQLAAEATPVRDGEGEPPRGEGQMILVVEDEPMVLRLSATALEDAGYAVVTARDAGEALDVLRREPGVALVFTDIVLGSGMNGKALADAVRAERPDLPVLFTTGYAAETILQDGRVEDGLVLLPKPFTSRMVVRKVGELLRARGKAPLAAL